jgi:hypothetical protein
VERWDAGEKVLVGPWCRPEIEHVVVSDPDHSKGVSRGRTEVDRLSGDTR